MSRELHRPCHVSCTGHVSCPSSVGASVMSCQLHKSRWRVVRGLEEWFALYQLRFTPSRSWLVALASLLSVCFRLLLKAGCACSSLTGCAWALVGGCACSSWVVARGLLQSHRLLRAHRCGGAHLGCSNAHRKWWVAVLCLRLVRVLLPLLSTPSWVLGVCVLFGLFGCI